MAADPRQAPAGDLARRRALSHAVQAVAVPRIARADAPPPAGGRPTRTILHVLAPGAIGGLESVVRSLASAQHAAGHRVHAALVTGSVADAGELAQALQDAGVVVHRVVMPSSRAYLRERAHLRALCEQLRPDVVHTHGYRADVIGASAARAAGRATVTTVHGFTGGGLKNRLYEVVQRRAFRRFSAVVPVSRPLAALLERDGVPAARLHAVTNGYDAGRTLLDRDAARRELGLPADGFVVGFVARLVDDKGLGTLLRAVASPLAASAHVAVLGDGPARGSFEGLARTLGIAERVTWCGPRADAARYFPAFDVFALPSRREGTPIVILEAMAAGVPVVATSVGGIPDLVGDDAILVAPDDADALAAALATNGEELRRRAARAATRVRTQYGLDRWVARYDDVYQAALRAAGRS